MRANFAAVMSYCPFSSVQNYISSPTVQNQYICQSHLKLYLIAHVLPIIYWVIVFQIG